MRLKKHIILSAVFTRRSLLRVRCSDNVLYRIERMDELSALSRDLGVQAPTALPLSSSSSSATTSAASSGSQERAGALDSESFRP